MIKDCKKTDHNTFRIKKVLKEKDNKSFEEWKGFISKTKYLLRKDFHILQITSKTSL